MTTTTERKPLERSDWTREEAEAYMERCCPDVRWELLEGRIVIDLPDPEHDYSVETVCDWLRDVFGSLHVRQEHDITLQHPDNKTSILMPDAAVTSGTRAAYAHRHPETHEILLIMEVANTSLAEDREKKRRLYARHQIFEYWVLDIKERCLYVYRGPIGGDYPEPIRVAETAQIAPLAAPQELVMVQWLLPPPS